jgi:hypothetical protein
MSQLLLSTRKGRFVAEPAGEGGRVARAAFVGDNALALGGGAAGNTTLALGSTTGHVLTGADRGQSGSVVEHHLPAVHAVAFAG